MSTFDDKPVTCSKVSKPKGSHWGPIGAASWATWGLQWLFQVENCKNPFYEVLYPGYDIF